MTGSLRSRSPRSVPLRAGPFAACGGILVLLGLGAVAAHPLATTTHPFATPGGPMRPTVAGTVLFNGIDTSSHGSAGAAIPSTFDGPYHLVYTWSAHGGLLALPTAVEVTGAQLVIELLGYPGFTDQVNEQHPVISPTGTINMTADFTQDRYLVEGLYLLTTNLLGGNGTTLWSGQFYLHVSAPYHLVALNVALVGVILFELYAVGSIRRRARAAEKRAAAGGSEGGGS